MDRATIEGNRKTLREFHAELVKLATRARYEGIDGAETILNSAAQDMAGEVEEADAVGVAPMERAPVGGWRG